MGVFEIAIILTCIIFVVALIYGRSFTDICIKWLYGCFSVLEFTMAATLLWLAWATIVESPYVGAAIQKIAKRARTLRSATLLIAFSSTILSWVNWIFGTYFALLLAREIARENLKRGVKLDYPFLLACAYSGSVVGFLGIFSPVQLYVADTIPHIGITKEIVPIHIARTVFSPSNIILSLVLIALVPIALYAMRPRSEGVGVTVIPEEELEKPTRIIYYKPPPREEWKLAHKLENSRIITLVAVIAGLYAIIVNPVLKGFLTLRWALFISIILGMLLNVTPIEYTYKVRETARFGAFILVPMFFIAGISSIASWIGLHDQIAYALIPLSPISLFLFAFVVSMLSPEPSTLWVLIGPTIARSVLVAGLSPILGITCVVLGAQLSKFLQYRIYMPLFGFRAIGGMEKHIIKIFILACITYVVYLYLIRHFV